MEKNIRYWYIVWCICFFIHFTSLVVYISVSSFGSISAFLGWSTKDYFPQPCDQWLGSSQAPSGSLKHMSDLSHQSSLIAISFGNDASKDNFKQQPVEHRNLRSSDYLSSGYKTRCTSSEHEGQCGIAGQGDTEHGTEIFSVCQMIWYHCSPMPERFHIGSRNFL